MIKEEWRWVKNDGCYQISNLGRVRSHKTPMRKWKEPRILVSRPTPKGYQRVQIYGKDAYIHRLVATAFLPNPNELPVVNHLDANRANNTLANLEWCTQKDNLAHAVKIGTMTAQSGEGNNFSKYTTEQVKKARELYASGVGVQDISNMIGMGRTTVSLIVHRRQWTTV